jgi:hypothetical protein
VGVKQPELFAKNVYKQAGLDTFFASIHSWQQAGRARYAAEAHGDQFHLQPVAIDHQIGV